ncbi:SCP2 sterol-binding domain-containing protein [Sansalvadorimonas sp. 2012CJ34-2]|uniref:SCP2 sterol-binding domain-containing protein n=1 Tax=Parendozoicomonas callyspongiae TaxID=2942213 RepID=A0ABT0PC37_9GAMM|nr:SCP2 sterol-binding domain-containing protein [Sansalvadorimonas sp. 2012CJ34-2]MCL6268821.1 SCP2 sterol-binding domain-containing protein [Sansalvadorimonas sp. 2012CJ34-2]
MSDVQAIMAVMRDKFDSEAAQDLDATLQFNLNDGGEFFAIIKQATIDVVEGKQDDPTVILMMESDTLSDILEGQADGMTCFMTGQLQVEGDMMLAGQITELFPA